MTIEYNDFAEAIDSMLVKLRALRDGQSILSDVPNIDVTDSRGFVRVALRSDGAVAVSVNPHLVGINGNQSGLEKAISEAIAKLMGLDPVGRESRLALLDEIGGNPEELLCQVRDSMNTKMVEVEDYVTSMRSRLDSIRPHR